ncbi:hypothetical protein AB0B88_16080 [Micromonospora haikouensis]|uniref:hypothetical protein n=1 Tax=Micromonospora haikouensis TaxID=686309 RepID=UPI0033CD0161
MEPPRRRRGRPALAKSERRKHTARTYLNEAERATLDEALAATGLKESDLLRRLSLEWAANATNRAPVLASAS